jgi:hypothetical protein
VLVGVVFTIEVLTLSTPSPSHSLTQVKSLYGMLGLNNVRTLEPYISLSLYKGTDKGQSREAIYLTLSLVYTIFFYIAALKHGKSKVN